MDYVISDTHFGHKSTLKFEPEPRPFTSVEEMNHVMIQNWNSVVRPEDTVYHLGDFAYKCSSGMIRSIFRQLNGDIVFIKGNHDGDTLKVNKTENRFKSVEGWLTIEHEGWKYFLCHFPVFGWHHKEKGAIHIHGHMHGLLTPAFQHPRKIDVSVEVINYTPILLNTIPTRLNLVPKITRFE